METSESENEDFQSADEFVSDDDSENTVKINEPLGGNANVDDEPSDDEQVKKYRKRPERVKIEETKMPIIRPDAILSDLTGQLGSGLSKGFASFTTKSSSIGSKVGNLVKEMVSVSDDVEFEYDDDRTVDEEIVRSGINEEIMKLSDAFVKLNEARAKEEEEEAEKTGWDDVDVEIEQGKNDGWEDWGETRVKEDCKSSEGWDDWGDEEPEKAVNEEPEKAVNEEPEKAVNEEPEKAVNKEPKKLVKLEAQKEVNQEAKDNDGWDDWGDDFEEIPPQKQAPSNPPQEWTGWDSFGQKSSWGATWGINTLLSTATAVTTNLSQGISTVIESGLGVPDPETLARIQSQEPNPNPKPAEPDLFQNLVTKIVDVSKVQEIGSRVLTGGLDTLETIGKKTMEVLQEGDPGLKKKRALIVNQGQKLSQVLKEARDRAVVENKKKTKQFETVFDDFQGLVHLEALEMLSKQCEIQIESIKQSTHAHKIQELLDTLDEVNQLCEIDEEFDDIEGGDFKESVEKVATPLKNELSVEKILQVHQRLSDWLKTDKHANPDQIYDEAISTIAELTAAITMQFHKSGELLLLKERRKTVEEADCLLQLSSYLCAELKIITEKCEKLLIDQKSSEILITNLRTESEIAITYVKQAFRLLVPVLQLGAT